MIDKVILNVYRKYNKDSNPIRIISVTLPVGSFDINLGEKKNEVVFKYEKEIVEFFEQKIEQFHEERVKLCSVNQSMDLKGNNEVMATFLNRKIKDDNIIIKKRNDEMRNQSDYVKDIVNIESQPIKEKKIQGGSINNKVYSKTEVKEHYQFNHIEIDNDGNEIFLTRLIPSNIDKVAFEKIMDAEAAFNEMKKKNGIYDSKILALLEKVI